jgi:lipid-A-disaccharide synthase
MGSTDTKAMQGKGGAPQIVFTVNGPGEISGWMFPLIVALRAEIPDLRIAVCLLPCVYSTGAETSVLQRLGVDVPISVRDSLALIFRGCIPAGLDRSAPTLIFHLGGEVALTVLLSKRLRAKVYAYAERPLPYGFAFSRVFYNGLNQLPARIAATPEAAVGELMVDAAQLRRDAARVAHTGRPTIGLFPGSREYMAEFLLPYYAVTVDALSAERPDIDWVMARADFVRMEFLRSLAPPPEDRTWPALPLSFHEKGNAAWLQTPAGNCIRILPGAQVLGLADCALTIPGTNTGEIAASGVPMVVILPTYLGHEVPLPGLAGHVGRLPLIGKMLKLYFGYKVLHGLPLLSQPNRRAGFKIVPELVGEGLHPAINDALRGYLDHDTTTLGAQIRDAMGKGGAAQKLAAEVAAFFAKGQP